MKIKILLTILTLFLILFLVKFTWPSDIQNTSKLNLPTQAQGTCKAGYNSGIALDRSAIDKAAEYNMKYVLLLTDNPNSSIAISEMITYANSKDITPIVRICWRKDGDVENCSAFKDANNYANFLKSLSGEFVAIAGPNEPMSEKWWLEDELRIAENDPVKIEDARKLAEYTRTILDIKKDGAFDNIKMISPTFNLHDCDGRKPFIDEYINSLGDDAVKFEGYGGNTYGSVGKCLDFPKTLYITEFGIVGDDDESKENSIIPEPTIIARINDISTPYNALVEDPMVEAILFFKPFEDSGNPEFSKHHIVRADGVGENEFKQLIQCSDASAPTPITNDLETPENDMEQEDDIEGPVPPSSTSSESLEASGYTLDDTVVKEDPIDSGNYTITYNTNESGISSTIDCQEVENPEYNKTGYNLSLNCMSKRNTQSIDNIKSMNFVNFTYENPKTFTPSLENYICENDPSDSVRYVPPSLKNIISFQLQPYEYEINYAALDCLKLNCGTKEENSCTPESYCVWDTNTLCSPSVDIDNLMTDKGYINFDSIPALVIPVLEPTGWNKQSLFLRSFAQTSIPTEIKTGVYEISGNRVETKTYDVSFDGEVKYYDDVNKNGRKDPTEKYYQNSELTDLTININKVAEIINYNLELGWNLLSFPFIGTGDHSSNINNASKLISELNSQGANITHISTYRSGLFVTYSERVNNLNETVIYGEDFKVVPGEGYFLKNLNKTNATLKGNKVTGSLKLTINPGWNLVSIYNELVESYKGFVILNDFNNQQVPVDVLSKWENGIYTNIVISEGTQYGNNFSVYPTSGYWVRNNSEKTYDFTPN